MFEPRICRLARRGSKGVERLVKGYRVAGRRLRSFVNDALKRLVSFYGRTPFRDADALRRIGVEELNLAVAVQPSPSLPFELPVKRGELRSQFALEPTQCDVDDRGLPRRAAAPNDTPRDGDENAEHDQQAHEHRTIGCSARTSTPPRGRERRNSVNDGCDYALSPWVRLEALGVTDDGGQAVQREAFALSDNLCSLFADW
jgi:hypothetical protein